MTRARARALAIAIAVTAALAAAVSADVVPQPRVGVLSEIGSASGGSSQIMLVESSSQATASVATIAPSGTCPAAVALLAANQPPFTIAPLAAQTVAFTCGSSSVFGLHRCHYLVDGSTSDSTFGMVNLALFTAVCAVSNGETSGAGATYLTASADPVTFSGSGAIVSTVTLTNQGPTAIHVVDLQIAGGDGSAFAILDPCGSQPGCTAAATIAAGGTLDVTLSCTPPAPGSHSGQLYAIGDTGAALSPPVDLACTNTSSSGGGVPILSVTGTPVIAAAELVPIGTAIRTITLTNLGGATLAISGLAIVGTGSLAWFTDGVGSCSTGQCTIAPGASAAIGLGYEPSALGNQRAQLQISSNDPAQTQLDVDLVGTGNGATMTLASPLGSPATLDFGSLAVGAMASATVVLDNVGTEDASYSAQLTGATAPLTVVAGPLVANGTATVTVTCKPEVVGAALATLTLTGTNLYASPDIVIAIACTGASGELLATPAAIELGNLRVGALVAPTAITVTTTDVAGVTLDAPMLDADGLAPIPDALTVGALSRSTIFPGMSATFPLEIETSLAEDLSAHIVLTTIGASPHSVAVPITGAILSAEATAPTVVNLGTFCVNAEPQPVLTSLRADGDGAVGLPATPTLAGAPSAFGLALEAPVAYPATLQSNASATVLISTTAQAAAGSATDVLTWFTDLPGQSTLTTEVDVAFIAGGGGVQPGFIDFGTVEINSVAAEQTVTIKNCGTTPLLLGAATVAAPFTVVPLPAGPIAAQGSVPMQVGFSPTVAGSFEATLSIDSVSGPLTVDLRGATIAGPPPVPNPKTPADRTSLYACSCRGGGGEPSAPIAIAIAVFAVVMPRRRAG